MLLRAQSQWEGERPIYDIRSYKPAGTTEMTRSYRYVRVQRLLGYMRCATHVRCMPILHPWSYVVFFLRRRMVPHVLGWFPCVAAWVCLIVQLENARNDLIPITDRRIPEWVDASLYGTFVIFFSFAPVQAIYQSLPPGFYWGSKACSEAYVHMAPQQAGPTC